MLSRRTWINWLYYSNTREHYSVGNKLLIDIISESQKDMLNDWSWTHKNLSTAWFHLYEVKWNKNLKSRQNKSTDKVVSSESEGRKSGMKEVSGVTEIYLDFSGGNWTDAKAETPVLWPPHGKSWLTGKDWCWEGLGAGGEGDDRGWDGWMASLTRWTWVWVNSGRWW